MAESCFEGKATSWPGQQPGWQSPDRNESTPFVHKFQTRSHKYIYDVNTRRILRVAAAVWEIVDDIGRIDDRQIADKHAGALGRDQIVTALQEIAAARQANGVFLPHRPKQVTAVSRKKVRLCLGEQREQLILTVTEDCNFRCSYCLFSGKSRHHRSHSKSTMSWPTAKAAIEEFLAHSQRADSRVISFYGGEPLLNLPLIRQCVGHVQQARGGPAVGFSLTTNGYLLTGEAAQFLAQEGFMMVVSLDGPAEIHDRRRRTGGGEGTWARVIANIRQFLEANPAYRKNGKIRFNAVVDPATDLGRLHAYFTSGDLFDESMGVEISELTPTTEHPEPLRAEDALVKSIVLMRGDFLAAHKNGRYAQEYNRRSRWIQASIFQKPLVNFHGRGFSSACLPEKLSLLNTCVPGARRTFVNARGEYYACERVVECPHNLLGNVTTGVEEARVLALLERWNQADGEECRFCWCLPACEVGCFATVSRDGTISTQAKRAACAECRRRSHQMLIDYCEILEANPKAFDYAAEMSFH